MSKLRVQFVFGSVLLVAACAIQADAALTIVAPVGWDNCSNMADGDRYNWREAAASGLNESRRGRYMRFAVGDADELSPLSSVPVAVTDTQEVDEVLVPLPIAVSIPPSVAVANPSSGGLGLASGFVVFQVDPLQTFLVTEASMILPAILPFRWFRPPRRMRV